MRYSPRHRGIAASTRAYTTEEVAAPADEHLCLAVPSLRPGATAADLRVIGPALLRVGRRVAVALYRDSGCADRGRALVGSDFQYHRPHDHAAEPGTSLVPVPDHQSAARVRPCLCRESLRRGSSRDGGDAACGLAGAVCRFVRLIGLPPQV